MALLWGQGHEAIAGTPVSYVEAATAFLAMLIAYTIGFHTTSSPPGFDCSQGFSRFNFGLPVATMGEAATAKRFERVFSAAFKLAAQGSSLKLRQVKAELAKAAEVVSISDKPFWTYEELAGVIAGYRACPDYRYGRHVIVDVGAATYDVVTFFLPLSESKVEIYHAGVAVLGAEALREARCRSISDETFKLACNHHFHSVYGPTMADDPDFKQVEGVPKQLLFVGGGRRTNVHSKLFGSMPHGLIAPMRTPEPGRNVVVELDADMARLLLAYGLAQDAADIMPLRKAEVISPIRHRSFADNYVDKDMC